MSPEIVGERMAGPGIRYWELAHVLSRDVDVTLAAPAGPPPPASDAVDTLAYHVAESERTQSLIQKHDALLIPGHMISQLPYLREAGIPIAVDLYIPSILENLEIHAHRSLEERSSIHRSDLSVLNQALKLGDFFLCASERQRDLWLGALLANNRINPSTYLRDATLRKLIDVVPFGLPADPPIQTRRVLKGIVPGIEPTDRVIVWGGGIYEWLDPLTLIEAVARLVDDGEAVRLYFMGTQHPNPKIPPMSKVRLSQQRSEALGLLDRYVFFNDWVPYAERQNYLLEADVGISLHLDHVETRFSFRTRVLDYIWAALPMILTSGDAMSALAQQHQLGIVVPPQDTDALVQGLRQILSSPDPRATYQVQFERLQLLFTWDRLAQPLRAFALQPWRSPAKARSAGTGPESLPEEMQPSPPWRLPLKAWRILRSDGFSQLQAEVHSYLQWRKGRGRS